MYYPRECFSINEIATQNAKREYDMKRKLWYDTAEKMFPNYYKTNLRERQPMRKAVDEAVGFSLH